MSATAASVSPASLDTFAACGVWAPALVPLTAELNADTARFVPFARELLDGGCHGLALFGTTSEANSFSVEERMNVLDAALDAGVPAERLMVGTGCCAYTDTLRLTRHAVERGIFRVLVLPPFYYKNMSDEGLSESFARVIDGVGEPRLRVFLYHFPQLSGVPITFGLIERLVERYPDVVAGVKDSSGDWGNMRELIERFPSMAIFPGSERYLLDALQIGGAGTITASANVNAGAIREVFDAWRAGRDDAAALQERVTRARSMLDGKPLVPVLKCLTAARTSDPDWRRVRPPMVAIREADGAALVEAAREAGIEV